MRGLWLPAFVSVALLGGCISKPSPFETTPETASVVDGNTKFGLDLYAVTATAAEDNDNIFISPASISTAIAMTYGGAGGATATQMSDTLHFYLPTESFHPAMSNVLAGVQRNEGGRTIAINNRVFVDQELVVVPQFSSLMSDTYSAPLQNVNFRNEPDKARQAINAWVEDKTEERIIDLIAPGDVTECTRMVLVNTIYLEANWAAPFKAENTHDRIFTTGAGAEVDLPLMEQIGTFRHLETRDFQALELPYQGKDLSLIVFLPKETAGLSTFEAGLTSNRLTNWLNKVAASEPVRVDTRLPKIELRQSLKLKPSLQSLGMRQPFSNRADFSGLALSEENTEPSCYEPMRLKIDDVVHQTFLKVDEKGTEAAAATAVLMVETSSARIHVNPPISFHANHPFFFVIRDNTTGLILFMGRFVGRDA